MDDRDIVALYWTRDQRAIQETDRVYGPYLGRVAMNVLADRQDADECVNDTYLAAWNSMPPNRPDVLSAYLGKITRRISLNRLRERLAKRRGGGEAIAAIEELAEIAADDGLPEDEAEARELVRVLERFLEGISPRDRQIFLRRYWLFDPVAVIARRSGMSQDAVKVSLHRTRKKLKDYLEKEEWL